MAHCSAWRRRTAEFAVALAVPTEGPKILGYTQKYIIGFFMNHGLLLIQPKSGGGGDAIAPRPPFSGGPLAETYDSCTAVLRYPLLLPQRSDFG